MRCGWAGYDTTQDRKSSAYHYSQDWTACQAAACAKRVDQTAVPRFYCYSIGSKSNSNSKIEDRARAAVSKSTAVESVATWALHPSRDGHIVSSLLAWVCACFIEMRRAQPQRPQNETHCWSSFPRHGAASSSSSRSRCRRAGRHRHRRHHRRRSRHVRQPLGSLWRRLPCLRRPTAGSPGQVSW